MAPNLKYSPEGLMEAFEHHVVYEVNMLRHTFGFLHVLAWSTELRNAIIKSFCVHARNLIGLFDENSATPGGSNYVGARHLCRNDYEPWSEGRPSNDLVGRLNRQIAHLTYDRTSQDEEKIGAKEQLELMRLIDQELEIFGRHLREPYASRWPFRDNAAGAAEMELPAGPLGATNQTTSISTYIGGATGPAELASKWVIKP